MHFVLKYRKLSGFAALVVLSAGLLTMQACQAKSKEASVTSSGRKILFYRHPMNPSVTSPVPNKDEMGMDYTPVYEDETSAGESNVPGRAAISIAPERQQLIGVRTAIVEEKPLTMTVRTLGHIGYKPDLLNAVLEYREALVEVRKVRGNPSTIVQQRSNELYELAMQKLRLVGLSDMQIHILTHSGQLSEYFQLPQDMSWVYADIYEYESNLVKPGQKVKMTAPSLPGETFEGTVRTVDEIYNSEHLIRRVRIEMKEMRELLHPGQSMNVEIQADLGTRLSVPEEAVLDSGNEQMVFVDRGGGSLEPRAVQTGREADGFIEILSGLSKGEKVVSSAAFLIDSESRLQAAAQGFMKTAKAPASES